jgi:hypothetical protein
LALMASFELCTDYISGFMGLGKPSSFCNYFVEPHPLLLGGLLEGE